MKFVLLVVFALVVSACGSDEAQCRRAADCLPGELCRLDHCEGVKRDVVPDEFNTTPLSAENADASQPSEYESDTGYDLPPHPCATASLPVPGGLIINEVYANVVAGPDGDANGDGERDAYSDEFVEILNASGTTLRLDGLALYVGHAQKWRADEPFCLEVGQAFVVFANGAPHLSPDIPVVVAQTRLSLTNAGGEVSVHLDDRVIDEFAYGDAEGAWTRNPEGTPAGSPIPHLTCGGPFSPGRCCDGTPTQLGCGD